MRAHLILVLTLVTLCPASFAQCGSPGQSGIPQIGFLSDIAGRDTSFVLGQGAPGADWACFVGTSGGPIVFPFGTFCLGGSTSVLFDSIGGTAPTLDAGGEIAIPVSVPTSLGTLEGTTFFLQAVVVDPTVSFGIAISDGETFSPRRPRVFAGSDIVGTDYAVSIEPSGPTLDWTASFTAAAVAQVLHAPRADRVVVRTVTGTVNVLDSSTGGLVTSFSFPTSFGGGGDMALANDGRTLLVLEPSIFGLPGTPPVIGNLRMFELETGTSSSITPSLVANILIPHPTRSVVYLADGKGTLLPIDYASSTQLPPIVTTGAAAASPDVFWTIESNILTIATSGFPALFGAPAVPPTLAAVDITTDTQVGGPTTIPISEFPISAVVSAVSSTGPAIFVNTGTGLKEVAPLTFALRQSINASGDIVRSSGGSELLILGASQLQRFDLATDTLVPLGPTTMPLSELAVTEGHAYYVDNGTLFEVTTDPAGPPAVVTTLNTGALATAFTLEVD